MAHNKWTLADIKKTEAGKNNAAIQALRTIPIDTRFKGNTNNQSGNTAKDWMLFNIGLWCNEKALTLDAEFVFVPGRKFRADYAIPALYLLCEYDGIYSETSRHTHFDGYNKDIEKFNFAAILQYRVLKYSNANYKNVIRDLDEYYKNFRP